MVPGAWGESQRSLHEEAQRLGHTKIVDLLLRYGAKRSTIQLDDEDAFLGACFRLDRAAAQALLAGHPEYLQSPLAIHTAAELDRADIVEFLLDLGFSPDIQESKRGNQRPLHVAAYKGSTRVAAVLIKRG